MSGDGIRVVHPLFQEEGDGSIPISPLQLEINEVDTRTAQALNSLWHSVLPETHLGNLKGKTRAVCYASHYSNRYYATAIWSTPIAANRMKDGWNKLELRRLAIADDAPKNTATRMLRVMRTLISKKWPEITGLVSYQAEDHHKGTIYMAAGWTKTGDAKSSVWHPNIQRDLRQTKSRTIRWEYAL